VGVVLLKDPDHRRQPVGGNAGVGGDGHAADEQAVDLCGQLKKAVLLAQKFPHRGQQQLAVFRQAHALGAAAKYGEAQLIFKGGHQLVHSRWGIAQHLRRPGKASRLCCRQYRPAPGCFHKNPSSVAVSNTDMSYNIL